MEWWCENAETTPLPCCSNLLHSLNCGAMVFVHNDLMPLNSRSRDGEICIPPDACDDENIEQVITNFLSQGLVAVCKGGRNQVHYTTQCAVQSTNKLTLAASMFWQRTSGVTEAEDIRWCIQFPVSNFGEISLDKFVLLCSICRIRIQSLRS